jgi:hypothetical protein
MHRLNGEVAALTLNPARHAKLGRIHIRVLPLSTSVNKGIRLPFASNPDPGQQWLSAGVRRD